MYRAVELTRSDRDLHRFVWRSDPNAPLTDYRMTRVTFGVSASSFAANMAVRQNAIVSTQLHGFSDASEDAYGGVVYLRVEDSTNKVHTALVISKTKVSPIKRLSIPRLELCGAQVLTKLLCHAKRILGVPVDSVFAWTDSTVVLGWLSGSPRRFKTFVGNRVSFIIDQLPPERWRHVPGSQNPADCASRGLFPAQLKEHELWWEGPHWLQREPSTWPEQLSASSETTPEEERSVCLVGATGTIQPIIPVNRYSKFTVLKRVTARMFRFIKNVRSPTSASLVRHPSLTVAELVAAQNYWISIIQKESFPEELDLLRAKLPLPKGSRLLPLRPFIDDSQSILRVGGRLSHSKLCYSKMHPIILHAAHPVTKVIVETEHLRLMHAGPTLLSSSLSRQFHIIGLRKIVRSVTRQCVTCKRQCVKPTDQLLGQLPAERVTPASTFDKVGVDYAGPFQIKFGHVRKPTVLKAYICLFVCLAVKAVHLELVSDLTAEAFIAALRRFVARRGCPSLIWSDHGTNFVGANRELREFHTFLSNRITQGATSEFCSSHNIEWKYIPERSPHFGGLWESAVKSVKNHLKRIVSPVKLTFEEFTTVLTQVEACLNSRPLIPIDSTDDDGIEVLTPGHFLIGKPVTAIPDPQISYRAVSLLRRWHLCQCLVRHFWQRWENEYLSNINKLNKWRYPTRNVAVGDIVVLQEGGTVPTKWPLGRVVQMHPGQDNLVRVVTLKTAQGTYKRPVSKIAVLLPVD